MIATFVTSLLGVFFLIVCILLIVVVLLQKGRGGGLSAAFGGGGGSSAFGTRTGDVMTWVTIVLTALFLLLAIVGSLAYRPDIGKVEAPVAKYTGPVPAEGRSITLSCPTKDAVIRYTTDGRDPTEKSRAYGKTPVVVTPGTTLKIKGFRVGIEPSETVTHVYTLEGADAAPALPSSMPTTAPAQ